MNHLQERTELDYANINVNNIVHVIKVELRFFCLLAEQSSTSGSSEEELTDEEDCSMEELTRKQQHPDRLHPEMWYADTSFKFIKKIISIFYLPCTFLWL